MAYKVVMIYHFLMLSYLLWIFTEYLYINKCKNANDELCVIGGGTYI